MLEYMKIVFILVVTALWCDGTSQNYILADENLELCKFALFSVDNTLTSKTYPTAECQTDNLSGKANSSILFKYASEEDGVVSWNVSSSYLHNVTEIYIQAKLPSTNKPFCLKFNINATKMHNLRDVFVAKINFCCFASLVESHLDAIHILYSSNKVLHQDILDFHIAGKELLNTTVDLDYNYGAQNLQVLIPKLRNGSYKICMYKQINDPLTCDYSVGLKKFCQLEKFENPSNITTSFRSVVPGSYCFVVKKMFCNASIVSSRISSPFKALSQDQSMIEDHLNFFDDWPFQYILKPVSSGTGLSLLFYSPGSKYNIDLYIIKAMKSDDDTSAGQCIDSFGSIYEYQTVDSFVNHTILVFNNLTPGKYCFRVKPKSRNRNKEYYVKHTVLYDVTGPDVERPVSVPISHKKQTPAFPLTIVIILAVIFFVIFVSSIFVSKKLGQRYFRSGLTFSRDSCLKPQQRDAVYSKISIFLVYTIDCSEHSDVIDTLVKLLQSFGFTVYHIRDIRCVAQIHIDPVNWLRKQIFEESIDGLNHKIIWIASELACLRFDSQLCTASKSVRYNADDPLDSLYEISCNMILERVKSTMSQNINKHMAVAELPYYRCQTNHLKGIFLSQRYELPKMLDQLLEFLCDCKINPSDHLLMNLSEPLSNQRIVDFAESVENMVAYKAENPDYIHEEWSKRIL